MAYILLDDLTSFHLTLCLKTKGPHFTYHIPGTHLLAAAPLSPGTFLPQAHYTCDFLSLKCSSFRFIYDSSLDLPHLDFCSKSPF